MRHQNVNSICDRALIALSAGDRNRLADIYDCMARLILSTAYAITGSYPDAEDVLQDTMLAIANNAHAYEPGSNARAWILTIVRHRSIDLVRKRRREIMFVPEEQEFLDAGISQLEVLDLLRLLGEEERQVILFRLYARLPYREIASILGISIASAQKQFQRAIKKLKTYDF